jgi:hypothetical protein
MTDRFLAAAIQVLSLVSEPLTAAEITQMALAGGLTTRSTTPIKTMEVRLHAAARDPQSAIEKVAMQGRMRSKPGSVRFRLRVTPDNEI